MDQRVIIKLLQRKTEALEKLVKTQATALADRLEKLQSASDISTQRALEIQRLKDELIAMTYRLSQVTKAVEVNEAWARDTLTKNQALLEQIRAGQPLLVQCSNCNEIRPATIGLCKCGAVDSKVLSWMKKLS